MHFPVPSASAAAIRQNRETLGVSTNPPKPTLRRVPFSAVSRFAFATALLVARPPVLARPSELSVSLAVGGFYSRASSHQVALMAAGYNYDAGLGIASAGLPPASPAASLAAPASSVLLTAPTSRRPSRLTSFPSLGGTSASSVHSLPLAAGRSSLGPGGFCHPAPPLRRVSLRGGGWTSQVPGKPSCTCPAL